MKRGSALLMALWIILTLSVIVLSFSFEARLQGGINIYVQGKDRVKRLIEAGRVLGEVVLVDFNSVEKITEPDDLADKIKNDDRWYAEKMNLKFSSGCTIGPILLDEGNPDSGTVSVRITPADGLNVNRIWKGEDPNWEDRWRVILTICGVPQTEVHDDEGRLINLQGHIIACWQDFRDEETVEVTYLDEKTNFKSARGAENEAYSEFYESHRHDFADEDRFEPANGEISDMKELSRMYCFRNPKFAEVLTGTKEKVADKNEREKREIYIEKGLLSRNLLDVQGTGKVSVNSGTVEQLMTVPGIYDPDDLDEGDLADAREIAEAIVACRSRPPQNYELPDDPSITEWGYGEYTTDQSQDAWWSDMTQRVRDEFDIEIPGEAKNYLAGPSGDLFRMKITATLLDMEYSAECECYVKDKKVRYVSWKE